MSERSAVRPAGLAEPAVWELLEARANRGLRTVITTSLPLTVDGYPDAHPRGRPYAGEAAHWHDSHGATRPAGGGPHG